DRNISLGEGGIVYNSIRSAIYDLEEKPLVLGYHLGLAGKEVRLRDVEQIAERTLKTANEKKVETFVTWI
ncbi:pyruvate ferredoxin oxidoreductase, partial [Candidatus Bathyarchaeota archaeon]|nr:pyruvate ferredoxin oxidoreductase [Candidatus Bathyarchaeota archaeon]